MTFAIIETGGKQYKVSASKILEVEKLGVEKGKTIQFKNVLLINDDKNTEVGDPIIKGAIVEAQILDNVKDRTILIFHKRRRKNSRKKNGHRQRHSKIQITKILAKDGKIIAEAKLEKVINEAKIEKKIKIIKILSKGGKIVAEAKPIELKIQSSDKNKKEIKKTTKKDLKTGK